MNGKFEKEVDFNKKFPGSDFLEQDESRGLNTQILVNIVHVIAHQTQPIHVGMNQNVKEIRPKGIQHELLNRLEPVVVRRILGIDLVRQLAETH